MTVTPNEEIEKALEAVDIYLEKASGFSCKQCPAPTDDDLSEAIKGWCTLTAAIKPEAREWRTDTPPMDGTPFNARFQTPMRFLPYKPSSSQFKSGIKGRWQEMNAYGGWVNCEFEPAEWSPAAPAKVKG